MSTPDWKRIWAERDGMRYACGCRCMCSCHSAYAPTFAIIPRLLVRIRRLWRTITKA